MSVHKSLKVKTSLVRARNVLNRKERIELLLKEGRLDEESSAFGLPKVKIRTLAKVKKKKKEKKEEGKAGEGATPAASDAKSDDKGNKAKENKAKETKARETKK